MNKLLLIDKSCHLENDLLPLMCIGFTKLTENDYIKYKNDIKK